MRRPLVVMMLIGVLMVALPGAQAQAAQSQGVAVITSPLEGATVSGIVPVLGTATHPQFVRYELAFGYSPNPTDAWFSILEPATTQIANDVLGRWDTTGIADGVYSLRLRVYWSDRAYLEAFVESVHVQNATPTPAPSTSTPSATLPAPTASPTRLAEATETALPPVIRPPTPTPRPPAGGVASPGGTGRLNGQAILGAFLDGVRLTLIAFLLLGAYAGLRAALRSRR